MKRIALALASALVGLAPSLALAQWNETFPIVHSPADSAVVSRRLESIGQRMAQIKAQGPRIATFDAAWPGSTAEYRALGGNLLLLVSAVATDKSEFPMRVYVRSGDRTIPLQRLASRLSEVDRRSSVVSQVGSHRDDEFYLLPANLALAPGDILIDFAANRQAFHLTQLPFHQPPELADLSIAPASAVDPSALRVMAVREFPGIVGDP